MSYLSIDNLYKNQAILMFKECYALEKIHGTSAWISYTNTLCPDEFPSRLAFFAGGGDYNEFIKLFDAEAIRKKLDEITPTKHVHIYGEYYGGKMMKMSRTYGDKMKFIVFEVKIGDCWLNVPKAEEVATSLGLEFVPYKLIPTTMEAINAECDDVSVQAIRNGMKGSTDHLGFCPPVREGIVLRPLEEVVLNSGSRVIAKHKRIEFGETKTPREVSPDKLRKIEEAKAIANEWVTRERLNHILGKGIEAKIENTGKVIELMTEDIIREAAGEIVDSSNARKEIARQTALLFKETLRDG
jgi:hypothetical protein